MKNYILLICFLLLVIFISLIFLNPITEPETRTISNTVQTSDSSFVDMSIKYTIKVDGNTSDSVMGEIRRVSDSIVLVNLQKQFDGDSVKRDRVTKSVFLEQLEKGILK
jgi:hypothetical protein